jgi:hypothetical protein
VSLNWETKKIPGHNPIIILRFISSAMKKAKTHNTIMFWITGLTILLLIILATSRLSGIFNQSIDAKNVSSLLLKAFYFAYAGVLIAITSLLFNYWNYHGPVPRRAILITLLLILLAFYNLLVLSREMIHGDRLAQTRIMAPLRYDFMRVPETPLALKYEAAGRLGGDFAVIYFPSQGYPSLRKAYKAHETWDPWGRPSRSAPFLHFICSLTLCRLPYGWASLLNVLIQTAIFFLVFWFAFNALGIKEHFLPSALVVFFCLFQTPVGLSWAERGQFSLYVAISYMFLILGFMKNNFLYIFFAAIFAFIKWTSFPFVFLAFMLYMVNAKDRRELRNTILMGIVFCLPIGVMLVCFKNESVDFIYGLFSQEIGFEPRGLSLARLLPKWFVKGMPVVLVVIGYINIREIKRHIVGVIPELIGSGVILCTYPTLAHDYSVPCLFGFIPFFVYWTTLLEVKGDGWVYWIEHSFFLFLVTVSFSTMIFFSELVVVLVYVAYSLACLWGSYFVVKIGQGGAKEMVWQRYER